MRRPFVSAALVGAILERIGESQRDRLAALLEFEYLALLQINRLLQLGDGLVNERDARFDSLEPRLAHGCAPSPDASAI